MAFAATTASGAEKGTLSRMIGARLAAGTVPPWAAALVRRAAPLAASARIVLLMLAAGTLLFRPADLIPALGGAPVYEGLMVACIGVSVPPLLAQLRARSLRRNAAVTSVLLLVPAVALSHLAHADTYDARFGSLMMLKACIFFLLIVALVDSPAKLRIILWTTTAAVLGMTALTLLQYHGLIQVAALRSIEQRVLDSDDGPTVMRLCGIGVFDDPNDYALILVVAIVISIHGLGERRFGGSRWLFLFPLALFAHALILTHSRGGAISALAALLAFVPARFGLVNAMAMAWILLPFLVFGPSWGRQTTVDVDNPEDTFQTRLDLWSQSIDAFRSSPIFGIGQGKLVDTIGHVTHNSFLHAFAELGLFGGMAFTGAFYLITRGLWRARPADPEMARLRPFMLALTVSYATGLLALSRAYTVPTQLVLGLGTAYLVLAARSGRNAVPRVSWACAQQVVAVSGLFLASTYVFVRVLLVRGAP